MGEEAFDEVILELDDGSKLHVTGGYGRREVCLGIQLAHGVAQKMGITQLQFEFDVPHVLVTLDQEDVRALRRAFTRLGI